MRCPGTPSLLSVRNSWRGRTRTPSAGPYGCMWRGRVEWRKLAFVRERDPRARPENRGGHIRNSAACRSAVVYCRGGAARCRRGHDASRRAERGRCDHDQRRTTRRLRRRKSVQGTTRGHGARGLDSLRPIGEYTERRIDLMLQFARVVARRKQKRVALETARRSDSGPADRDRRRHGAIADPRRGGIPKSIICARRGARASSPGPQSGRCDSRRRELQSVSKSPPSSAHVGIECMSCAGQDAPGARERPGGLAASSAS